VDSERLALVEAEPLMAMGPVAPPGLYQGHGVLPGGPAAGSWLALQRVQGDDADTAFAKLRPSPSPTAAAAHPAAMCEAVADFHAGGWRHGDLQEVHFILDGAHAHLLDFAMAHAPDRTPGNGPGIYRGAYDWFMSPELAHARLSLSYLPSVSLSWS
jgi:hypothetical protein